MPPRVPTQSLQLCCAELSSSGSSIGAVAASPLERALLSSQCLTTLSTYRSFSTTTSRQRRTAPLAKQRMQDWLKKRGKDLKTHNPGQTNYIGGETGSRLRPFPSNPAFISQPVLSEEARETIWQKVMVDWEGIKAVSAELGVDQRRVAAVVRMKEIEKDWQKSVRSGPSTPTRLIPSFVFYDDTQKNSISLEDAHTKTWLQKSFASLSDGKHILCFY